MLGLAKWIAPSFKSTFVSFSEGGCCRDFLREVRGCGFEGIGLRHDTPRFLAALKELRDLLPRVETDILCCHGYKANLLGWLAARRLGIPVVSISHGWTGESLQVRSYELLDRLIMRRVDRVVPVSAAQAKKVQRAGISPDKTVVIRNAIQAEPFGQTDSVYRDRLRDLFVEDHRWIVGAAGRLSPEKGFDVLIDAAAEVTSKNSRVGFVVFGDGALRERLLERIRQRGLERSFVLAGFHSDLDRYLPHLDLFALSSFTEGLPVVVLEAFAAGVPVVATRVGGVPEVVEHGVNGFCVESGRPEELARGILDVLTDEALRCTMGQTGRKRVVEEFTFDRLAKQYQRLFEDLVAPCPN